MFYSGGLLRDKGCERQEVFLCEFELQENVLIDISHICGKNYHWRATELQTSQGKNTIPLHSNVLFLFFFFFPDNVCDR